MQALNKVSLEARHISLSYGATPVLQGVNLRVEPGEFFALLGPSGSGKSTLLRLIAGFNQHQSGELLVDGKDITGVPPHARNVGMVFQNYALWPHMTVWDNVAFGLVERRESRDAIRRKVGAALELVGLESKMNRHPNEMSGGEQQRLAIARALVNNPSTIIADEPTGNLDPERSFEIMALLQEINNLGTTMLVVTHDQNLAKLFHKRTIAINEGVVVRDGIGEESKHEAQ